MKLLFLHWFCLSFQLPKNQWHCHEDFLVRNWMSVDTDHRWRIYTIRTVSCLFILSSSASVTLWNHFPHWWQQIIKLPSDWQLIQTSPLNPLRTENLLQQVPRCDLLCWLDKDWAHFLFCYSISKKQNIRKDVIEMILSYFPDLF